MFSILDTVDSVLNLCYLNGLLYPPLPGFNDTRGLTIHAHIPIAGADETRAEPYLGRLVAQHQTRLGLAGDLASDVDVLRAYYECVAVLCGCGLALCRRRGISSFVALKLGCHLGRVEILGSLLLRNALSGLSGSTCAAVSILGRLLYHQFSLASRLLRTLQYWLAVFHEDFVVLASYGYACIWQPCLAAGAHNLPVSRWELVHVE